MVLVLLFTGWFFWEDSYYCVFVKWGEFYFFFFSVRTCKRLERVEDCEVMYLNRERFIGM